MLSTQSDGHLYLYCNAQDHHLGYIHIYMLFGLGELFELQQVPARTSGDITTQPDLNQGIFFSRIWSVEVVVGAVHKGVGVGSHPNLGHFGSQNFGFHSKVLCSIDLILFINA